MKQILRDIGIAGLASMGPMLLLFWSLGGIDASWPVIPFFVFAVGALIASYIVKDEPREIE